MQGNWTKSGIVCCCMVGVDKIECGCLLLGEVVQRRESGDLVTARWKDVERGVARSLGERAVVRLVVNVVMERQLVSDTFILHFFRMTWWGGLVRMSYLGGSTPQRREGGRPCGDATRTCR